MTKTKELEVYQALEQANLKFEYQKYIPFAGCGFDSETKHAYLDFAIESPWGCTILEVDEHQHSSYDVSCDVRRDFDIVASVALGSAQKLRIIHYNPDSYKVAGKTVSMTKKDRLASLLKLIQNSEEPVGFERVFMFYDRENETSTLPLIASSWDAAARTVSKIVPL